MRNRLLPSLLTAVSLFIALATPATAQEAAAPSRGPRSGQIAEIVAEAQGLERLHALIVAQNGRILIEESLRGPALDQPVNIKSASKSIISALVGRAIGEGLLEGVDQPIAPLLAEHLPDDPDPRLRQVTIGNLLSMQAGLERTSGRNYGRWVASRDWVRFALSRPFADEPGGGMLYSTGSTHLLSAILTKVSGRSTRDLLVEWLGEPLGIEVGAWDRMALSPLSLLRFGEMMRNRGKTGDTQLLSPQWIDQAWTPRTRSVLSGDRYGYGWFMREMRGHKVYYAWGYGGQMLYIVPDLALTIVMTSDDSAPGGRSGHVDDLHDLVADRIIPAAEQST